MDLDDIFSFKGDESKKTANSNKSLPRRVPISNNRGRIKANREEVRKQEPKIQEAKKSESKTEKNALIFSGITFIITGIKYDKALNASLREKIKSNGGQIKNFRPDHIKRDASSPNNFPRAILISDNYQVTYKYIVALAQCVPCVHYLWVEDCINENDIIPLEKYLLPAGCDLDRNIHKLPKWFALESQDVEDNVCPFLDKRIEIVGVREFKQQWTTILKACGARIVSRLGVNSKIDVILSDSYPASYVICEALEIGCPICNKEWAIQTLIQRKLQDWNDERYLVKYS